MTIDNFKKKVVEAQEECRVDELCFLWLEDLAKEHGGTYKEAGLTVLKAARIILNT